MTMTTDGVPSPMSLPQVRAVFEAAIATLSSDDQAIQQARDD